MMRIRKASVKFLSATLLAALGMGLGGVVSVRAAPTFYVATNGDDTWSGQLADPDGHGNGPWRTIQHAATASAPGDTIEVRAGIYKESVWMDFGNSGTPSAPKTLTAYPGEQVTLDGAVYPAAWTNDSGNIWYTDASGIDFNSEGQARLVWQDDVGLAHRSDLASMTTEGTWWYDTNPPPDPNSGRLYVWLNGGGDPTSHTMAVQSLRDAFALNAASWIVLDGFRIVHYFHGIEQLDGVGSPVTPTPTPTPTSTPSSPRTMEGLTVRNCDIEHIGEGILLGGGDLGAWGITNNSLIERNTVQDAQGDGIWVGTGTDHVVRRNRISDVKPAWFSLLIPAAIRLGTGNTRVENNIIYNTHALGILVNTEGGPARGNTIVNNTIYHGDDRGISIEAGPSNPGVVPENTVIGNNIFDALASAAIEDHGTNTSANYDLYSRAADLANLQAAGQEANGSFGDPSFVSAGSDFHLSAGSPAIDTGSNTLAPAEDFFGAPRPIDGDGVAGAVADIGATEYNPAPTSTLTNTPTSSPTSTETPSATMTGTPSPTITLSPTLSVTPTVSPTASSTSTTTLTTTLTPSTTLTLTITGSTTPTRTPTSTPSPTLTRTRTRTPSRTPTRTRTQTPPVVLSATASPSPSATPSPTLSPSYPRTPTDIVTVSNTPTPTLSPMETPALSETGDFPQPTLAITAASQGSGSSSSGTGLSALKRESGYIIFGIAVFLIIALAALIVLFFPREPEQEG